MYRIVEKRNLNETVTLMIVEAPLVAKKALAGQFIILRPDEKGERIPLTIADYDRDKGTVTIIFQIVGETTKRLGELGEGEYILDFTGPLGTPSELDNAKNVCVIGGGVGCAIAYPSAKACHLGGASVDVIAGFRNKDIVILEDEFRAVSDNLYITTDDGSYGEKGFVTDKLRELIESGKNYDLVVAIGPIPMMKFVSKVTEEYGIRTLVSLNPIMIDGTGMCGGCRVTVGGEVKFACVDGPDFDGHKVDFDELMKRNSAYRQTEHRDENCRLLTPKANMRETKVPMPVREPEERSKTFDEVALGYTAEMAVEEATRCLECKHMPCVNGCPVNVRIPEFVSHVKKGEFEEAYKVITATNGLPAICGRVCPQETQCESKCVRGIKHEPVGIGRLERFCADYHNENNTEAVKLPESNGIKVAVIGSGPAGLSCAGDLAKKGYDVTVFEAFHTAGGVLVYGIPEFRLPKSIVGKEIENLKALGVKIETNTVIGKTISIDELMSDMGFKACFVGSGAGLPSFLGIEGEGLVGVFSANEYLTRTNLMKAYREDYNTPILKSNAVAVVGGGNVAMDAARCAKRLGADTVYIVYRRGLEEMPARKEEVEHAMEEGIIFRNLTNPVKILGDESGRVNAMECVEMELGEPDASGRRSPIVKEGSNFLLPVDTVIVAIGTTPNPLIRRTTPGIETNRKGCLIVDEHTMQTTRQGVYAGGDAVTGAATVILAMGAGKQAAKSIDEYLKND